MAKIKQNAFVNLPSDIKILLASGKYSLYTLSKKMAHKGTYLLALSRDDTFFLKEDGTIGESAGKLGEVAIEGVVRIEEPGIIPSIKLNIA